MLSIVYFTNRVFNSRTYILSKEGCDKVWLVDCGDVDKVFDWIGVKSVEGVLLTHAHTDHIYGLGDLLKRFPSVMIYTNSYGVEALRSPKLNISHYHPGCPDISIEAPDNVRVIKDKDVIKVLGVDVKVFETPGHAPSCVTYLMEDKAFTGDAYIPNVKVFTGFPHSNREQAAQSVAQIIRMTSNYHVYPGHTVSDGMDKMGD